MAPSLGRHRHGLDPTRAIVMSQVARFGLPFALIPLIMFTRRQDLMGVLVNRTITNVMACIVAGLIVALNIYLVVQISQGG